MRRHEWGIVAAVALFTVLMGTWLAFADPRAFTDSRIESYARSAWRHWVTSARNPCWTVREEVLIRDASTTTLKSDGCDIDFGAWVDPYSGRTITKSGLMDVDHLIPLKWAHEHGAAAWSHERKQQYANDVTYCCHLLATDRSENRRKGDRGPADYKPPSTSAHCAYAQHWIVTMYRYDLKDDARTREALEEMLGTCAGFVR